MDPEKTTQIESAEELEAEKQHLGEVKEDEVRASLIEEFGFDEEVDKERIEKMVSREIDSRKKLSSAIGQKIKYRTEYSKLKTNPSKADNSSAKYDEKDLDKRVNEKFEQRDLESMDYPDDIKKSIARIAKLEEISVRKAVSDPYVVAKIESWKKTKEAEDAALGRNNRGGSKSSADIDNPPDVDMATEAGRAEYDKWRADMIKAGY